MRYNPYVTLLLLITLTVCATYTFTRAETHVLSDAELAGAVIMPAFEKGVSPKAFGEMLCDVHAVSYMILRPDWSKKMIESVQKSYDKTCGPHLYRLLVAIDAEPSLLKTRIPTLITPKTSELTTAKDARTTAYRIAQKLKEAGISITFAPVYDSNENTAVIGNRSFGRDSETIQILTRAYVAGTRNANVLPTAKHFPGHGHAKGDTHATVQSIPGTLPELPQFEDAVKDKVPFMMVGHLIVSGGEWDSANIPASLSHKIVTVLLKEKLAYQGIVITDALNMGAVASRENAALEALTAGADIVLFPKDTKKTHAQILKKILSDVSFKEQIKKSVEKIITTQKNIFVKKNKFSEFFSK